MRILFVTFFFLILSSICGAQSIADLQKKKQDAVKEIEYTARLLNEVQKNERSSLGSLRLIKNKISQRNTIISSINSEINLYQEFIANNSMVIDMLKNDVNQIKIEYAELIRSAYRNRNAYDKILFLLSAENVNQAHRRFLYLKRYTTYRENQSEIIGAIQLVLDEKRVKLEQQKAKKQQLIGETQKEAQQLITEKKQQDTEFTKLQNEKKKLRKKLKQQQGIEQKLERQIQLIIEEEARKSRDSGGSGFALTPEQKLVGDNFAQNKKRLPWPVERGIIIEHFGIHQHPVLTNVEIKNNGINIATEIGAKVRAVFNGEVSRVFGISGGNTAVIIRHGKYLSVYSNLREVVVKKGDKVAIKQEIGTVYFDKDDGDKSIIKFQIWYESQKLNPEDWIGR
ncbi:MAG: peptidoglycan DD-metalloendopeptidase family protein [Draconibacterium sp.]|nr:peptidoglycan DD-metalloendopeptidase family protein [Draconibacterium sp.]